MPEAVLGGVEVSPSGGKRREREGALLLASERTAALIARVKDIISPSSSNGELC